MRYLILAMLLVVPWVHATRPSNGLCRFLCMTDWVDLPAEQREAAWMRSLEFARDGHLQVWARRVCRAESDSVLVPFIPSFVNDPIFSQYQCEEGRRLLFSTGLVFKEVSSIEDVAALSLRRLCFISFDSLRRADHTDLTERMSRFIQGYSVGSQAPCMRPTTMRNQAGQLVPFRVAIGSDLHVAGNLVR